MYTTKGEAPWIYNAAIELIYIAQTYTYMRRWGSVE